jgi:hypothetical protein
MQINLCGLLISKSVNFLLGSPLRGQKRKYTPHSFIDHLVSTGE